jgi:DNA polymerase IIIc chi subunit
MVKVVATLLQKILQQNDKAIILTNTKEEAQDLDTYLWAQSGWIPHCIKGDEHELDAKVIISYDENIDDFAFELFNNIKFIFVLNNAKLLIPSNVHKVFIIFTPHLEDVLLFNRARWKEYKSLNWELNYYTQEKNGKFIQMLI